MPRSFRPAAASALALVLTLTACGGSNDPTPNPVAVAPVPSPTPAPLPTTFNVTPCFTQTVPGFGGATVVSFFLPDTLTIDLSRPMGFPNGRRLEDPVIDITLAMIFLDLDVHGLRTLADARLNPTSNDRPFRTTFPYLATPQGTPPISGTAGTSFDFRTDPESAFVRVDRGAMPAVATALVAGPRRNAYNDGNPVDDAANVFVPDLTAGLTSLTSALADDFQRLNLTSCAQAG